VQCLPYVGTAAAGIYLVNFYIRISHPGLAGWLPIRADWRLIGSLLEGSFWIYLCALGNAVYRSTDALLINAGSHFPAGTLTGYDANYRACDVTVSLAVAAGFVSMPKITQWLASSAARDRERAQTEIRRLNQFQSLMGFMVALGYLAGNSLFITIWWLHKENQVAPAELALQIAFALNMVVTCSGAVGVEVTIRVDRRSLRVGGLIVALSAVVNVGLSVIAMRAGSLVGIALATVVAQSLQSALCSAYACRRLKIPLVPWLFRTWLLPVAGLVLAGWVRMKLPLYTPEHGLFLANVLALVAAYAALIVGMAALIGIRPSFIKEELAILRGFLKR